MPSSALKCLIVESMLYQKIRSFQCLFQLAAANLLLSWAGMIISNYNLSLSIFKTIRHLIWQTRCIGVDQS